MAARPPVFIVGSPRSGTTLLRKVLDRHPALAICGETRFYGDVYARRRIFGDLSDLRNRRRLVEQFLSTVRAKRIGVDPARLRAKLLSDANSYQALFTCILEYYTETRGKKRCGEKTPHHAFFTETLCEWFPGAAIIHLVRDPRDVVASLQLRPWAPSSVVNNAWMWVLFNRGARRSSHRPGYLLVHYEKPVAHPEQELMRICAHVGEDYAASMLARADAATGPYSWPQHASGPVTTERLGEVAGAARREGSVARGVDRGKEPAYVLVSAERGAAVNRHNRARSGARRARPGAQAPRTVAISLVPLSAAHQAFGPGILETPAPQGADGTGEQRSRVLHLRRPLKPPANP